MSDRISTKAGVFESGEKDVYGVQYKDGRLISCRNNKLEDYAVADGTEVVCDRAFMNLKDLKSVSLPASVKAIGESAFSGCKSLTDVNIPEGVTEIRQATFRDCDALAAIELPSSVTEIDKFAFGRGLTTLVVNAPEMKIDKYAFMNAKDFATLIVPAGSADYYRALLADIRVKAEVEEMEEISKTNNMEEEKKMKTVTVEIRGTELFLEPKDRDEEEVYDAYSRFRLGDMIITVDGKEFKPIDLGLEYKVLSQEQLDKFKSFDVAKFFEESGAEEGMLYTNKAWTTIEIEIPENEEFNPNKATLVGRGFKFSEDDIEPVVCAFGYDGKVYDCAPGDSDGISGKKIWQLDDSEKAIEYTDQTASDNQLADAAELPVLVFRYQTLSYCYEARDAYDFDADDYPDFEGPGVVSAVNDAGMGKMFICQDCIEYISSGEINDELYGLLDYEITLAATEQGFILLNSNPDQRPAQQTLLETIAAVWRLSSENCSYKPAFDKLIFRAIARDTDDYTTNEDYLLDHGKIYALPEGKFDEIVKALSAEDQTLNQDITPFDEYEKK